MNKTQNYNLNQVEPADKPGWLTTYNEDMRTIDTHLANKANAGSLEKIPLLLTEGVVGHYDTPYYCRTDDGVVHACGVIKKDGESEFEGWEVVATLPEGFRPSSYQMIPISADKIFTGRRIICFLAVTPSGKVSLNSTEAFGVEGVKLLHFNISFVAQ